MTSQLHVFPYAAHVKINLRQGGCELFTIWSLKILKNNFENKYLFGNSNSTLDRIFMGMQFTVMDTTRYLRDVNAPREKMCIGLDVGQTG